MNISISDNVYADDNLSNSFLSKIDSIFQTIWRQNYKKNGESKTEIYVKWVNGQKLKFLSLCKQNVMIDANKKSELSKYISDSKKILLTCHMNPDGDAIGSMIAMYSYLKSKGKEVVMMSPNYLQEFLKWMDSSDNINIYI